MRKCGLQIVGNFRRAATVCDRESPTANQITVKTNTYVPPRRAGGARTKAAFFDLDNTLIGGDSDYLWSGHLARLGVVHPAEHRRRNERFMRAYQRGTLDVEEFLAFQLDPLRRYPMHELEAWRAEFIETDITPLVLPKAMELLEWHRRLGECIIIVTSTNRFISEPIARLLGVDHLLATELELSGGRFTGRVSGPPCAGDGKVIHAKRWADSHDACLGDAPFYTDSISDLPLMEAVGTPVAVDPDERLKSEAERREWTIITLR